MAKKGTTPKPAELKKCELCGKILKVGETHGALCAKRIANGQTGEALRAHYRRISADEAPAGYIKVADLHRLIVATPESGANVNKMVRAIGRDRALEPALHPIAKPVYVGRIRYVNGWLATAAGLKAIASGDFSKAPAAGTVTKGKAKKVAPKVAPEPEPVLETVAEMLETVNTEEAVAVAE